jgi:hypothetical protein
LDLEAVVLVELSDIVRVNLRKAPANRGSFEVTPPASRLARWSTGVIRTVGPGLPRLISQTAKQSMVVKLGAEMPVEVSCRSHVEHVAELAGLLPGSQRNIVGEPPAELHRQLQGVCGTGTLRFAHMLQRTARPRAAGAPGGPLAGSPICPLQAEPYAPQNVVSGWPADAGPCEAPGARHALVPQIERVGSGQVAVGAGGAGAFDRGIESASGKIAGVALF